LVGILFPSSLALANDQDIRFLTEGVGTIQQMGVPGPLCSFGEKTFPVILGKSGSLQHPLVVAGKYGRGRVVAFGHGGYLTSAKKNIRHLVSNCVRWTKKDRKKLTIGVLKNSDLATFLHQKGFTVMENPLSNLPSLHVLIADCHYIKKNADYGSISRFIQKGGGFITAGLGWGWSQLNPGKDLVTEHPGNKLLSKAGIVWASGYLDKTDPKGFKTGKIPSAFTQANKALSHFVSGTKLEKQDRAQALGTLSLALRSIPSEDKLLLAMLGKILKSKTRSRLIPTKESGLGLDNPLERLLLTWELITAKKLPPEKRKAHPASTTFPGKVPSKAKRVRKNLSINTSVPGWHSTGLYAIPGKVISISLPPGGPDLGLHIRIGSHKDELWKKDSWWRAPQITNEAPLNTIDTQWSNPFGGLIYLVVPRNGTEGVITISIKGAVQAPLYLHGQTDLKAWKKTIRHYPGPWAEIGSQKMIVTVPSHVIRSLDAPDKVAEAWDRIMDLEKELAGKSCAKDRPARIVPDVQISAGYMHSGYPIMTHLDQITNLVDVAHLRKGNWGFFHELGHNHQNGDWTFGGTGEVTVNLFSLYVFEYFCDIPTGTQDRSTKTFRQKLMKKMDFDNPDFAVWKSDPFLALVMYIQIQQEFGWDPFRKVFRDYLSLPKNKRPKTDGEKRDQWMIRMSRQVGKNLAPFFQLWGVPLSEEAISKTQNLPVWISKDFPEKYQPKK